MSNSDNNTNNPPIEYSDDVRKARGWPWSNQEISYIWSIQDESISREELEVLLDAAARRRLDPVSGQVRLSVHNYETGPENRRRVVRRVTVTVGIDGLRLIVARTNRYAGSRTEYEHNREGTAVLLARTTVRLLVGSSVIGEFVGEARWPEFYPGKRRGFMWDSKPHVMLGKCSEAQALRRANPEELAGLYIPEELERPMVPQDEDAPRTVREVPPMADVAHPTNEEKAQVAASAGLSMKREAPASAPPEEPKKDAPDDAPETQAPPAANTRQQLLAAVIEWSGCDPDQGIELLTTFKEKLYGKGKLNPDQIESLLRVARARIADSVPFADFLSDPRYGPDNAKPAASAKVPPKAKDEFSSVVTDTSF